MTHFVVSETRATGMVQFDLFREGVVSPVSNGLSQPRAVALILRFFSAFGILCLRFSRASSLAAFLRSYTGTKMRIF